MSENDSDFGAFMAGFVIGGFVGAAAALVLAPQSGEETRATIAARSDEVRRLGEQRVQEYRTMAGGAVTDARSRMQEGATKAQERARIVLDEGKGRVTEAIEVGKKRTMQGDASNDTPDAGDEAGNLATE